MAAYDTTPATAKQGNSELLACLTLVAPSGMSAEDRAAWVAVARQTLTGIPADLLAHGCEKARKTCRFASEIVPTILEETETAWRWRQKRESEMRMAEENRNAPRLARPEHQHIPHEETQRIIREAMASLKA